ncbi:U32 family peptidase [Cellulosilyticum ruminicola]|uniref:U32 family peptidase n=1 Tax=Cellulosilyticum ruminicola TaxID=425254 RepID=UPI0006CFDBEE|nr:U32 family peptidase [Cellulosilyticum ruminicola]
MKILAPLSQIENFEPLVEAGADEFFAGIFPYEWLKKYNAVFPINRREYIFGNCNISSMNSMRALSRKKEEYNISVKIAFNSHYFMPEQYPMVAEAIKMLMDLGYNTFILSDVALIVYLREHNFKCAIHISGEIQVLNEYSAKFLEQLNIERFIFPRRSTIKDMENVIKNSGLTNKDYEAFMMNSFCPYDGAFCNSLHCDELQHICWIKAHSASFNQQSDRFKSVREGLPKYAQAMQYNDPDASGVGCEGCGLCAIKSLEKIGITNLKVVGRGVSIDDITRDIRTLRDVMNMSKVITDQVEFSKAVQDKYFNGDCSNRLCYYPEK